MTDHRLVFIAHRNPCLFPVDGPDDVLGELTEATSKEWLAEYNDFGQGSFEINLNSEQAAWCTPGNYIRVYRDSVAGDLIGGFFIETGGDTLVSADEQGGEIARRAGRGSLAILERPILYNESFLPNGGDLGALPANDPDGMWHWTDRPPGAILVRQLEEAQARGGSVDESSIPPVTWDFTRTLDSNGNAWESSAGDLFKLAVGIRLMEAVQILKDLDLIVYMSPDFALEAWDTDQGVDRTADIQFVKGENIRGDSSTDREIVHRISMTVALVQGDLASGALTYVNVESDGTPENDFGRIEGFVEFPYTPTEAKMEKAGLRAINKGYNAWYGVDTVPVLEREDEIPLLHYFPGDIVTVLGVNQRISKIRLFDRDNDEYDVDVQFELQGFGLGGGGG